tara:strand:+ start:124 stop:531 length:408 start_codon:yes stop_codon:yes gene_type:complete
MATYKDASKIYHVAESYYNDRGYCSVVALAIAAGIGYGKAFHTFRRLGRRLGTGTHRPTQQLALAEFGLKLEAIPGAYGCRTTKAVGRIAHRLQGTFWVYCTGHVACIKDGQYYDWAATRNKRNVGIYKVVPINT